MSLSSSPASPLSPELINKGEELEQLFLRLMGREINEPELRPLLAASVDPNKSWADADLPGYLDRLLAPLRQLLREEHKFVDFWTLCATIRQMYGIR